MKVIIVHRHYDTWLSTGSEQVDALVQALLRPTMYSMVEHTLCGYSMGMGMHSVGQL